MKRLSLLLLLLLTTVLVTAAITEDSVLTDDGLRTTATQAAVPSEGRFWKTGMGRFLKRADAMLERMQRSGIDTAYQEVPKLNRQVYIGGYAYFQDYRLHFPFRMPGGVAEAVPQLSESMFYETKAHSFLAEMDLGIDWKGLLIEIPIPVRSSYIRSYGLAKSGSVWGFRLRYKRASNLTGTRNYGNMGNVLEEYIDENQEDLINSGINADEMKKEVKYFKKHNVNKDRHKLKTFFAEGYYVLNSSKFSLSAGLFSEMVQKRSAGSLLFYGNYYWSRYSVSDMFVSDFDSFRTQQFSLGCGYGYNWSLNGGRLLLHGSVVPMFSVYSDLRHESRWEQADPSMTEEEIRVLEKLKKNWSSFYDSADNGKPRFRANAFARIATSYSFNRYVITFLLNYRNYGYSNDKHLGIMNQEIDAQLNLGVRF